MKSVSSKNGTYEAIQKRNAFRFAARLSLTFLISALTCFAYAEGDKPQTKKPTTTTQTRTQTSTESSKATENSDAKPNEDKVEDSQNKDTATQMGEMAGKALDSVRDTTKNVSNSLGKTRDRREAADGYILGNYSPIDFLLPGKIGGTIGLISSADRTYELEYLRASVAVPFLVKDLGSMTDQRISLISRSYGKSNSFNLSYGLSYFDFDVHLGDSLLSKLSGGSYPSIDLVQIQSLGFNVGIGNRWTFDRNITLGVDWISWSQPVFVTNKKTAFLDYATNAEDKDKVDQAVKVISYFPRFAFFKLQLGILF